VQLGQDMDHTSGALLHDSGSSESSKSQSLPSTSLMFNLDWDYSPLRKLLRRQQLETEHLSAQRFMEVVALRNESATAQRLTDDWMSGCGEG
jgi:hypothetical protein